MTTIKLKNGSGAPATSDLVQGEPALDLTNKRLYTENASGTVIEVGTNPSTLTVDTTTLVVDAGNNRVGVGTASPARTLDVSSGAAGVAITTKGSGTGSYITFQDGTTTNDAKVRVGAVGDNLTLFGGGSERMRIDSAGNVGIGTTSPDADLEIRKDNASGLGAVLSLTNSNTSGLTGNSVAIGLSAYTHTTVDSASYRGAIIKGETTVAGNGHSLIFETSDTSAAPTERMRIDHDGNVGIGTNSPAEVLHVANTATAGAVGLRAENSEGHVNFTTNGGGFQFETGASGTVAVIDSNGNFLVNSSSAGALASPSTGRGLIDVDGTSDSAIELKAGGSTYGYLYTSSSQFRVANLTANPVTFFTNNAERMRIKGDGNVGIGTTNPLNKLVVSEGTGQHGIEFAPGTTSYIQAYDRAIADYGDLKIDAQIIQFGTDNGTERMRIDSSGDLLVGNTLGPLGLVTTTTTEGFGVKASETYVAISRSNNGAALFLNKPGESTSTAGDFIQCRQNGTNIGEIQYDGADLSIVQVSDQRLKSNIVNSASAGSIIDAMQVRSFDWNDGVHVDYGFVAQELNQAYEPATKVGGDDVDEEPWGIKTQKLIPLLVKEIQDLRARVAQLEGA